MGRRSGTESVVLLLQAFLRQRTWSQADLARELGIGPRALRQRLAELTTAGVPLERDEDPPHVWWSVPRGWFPGGAVVSAEDVQLLLRQLCRLPRGAARDGLVRRLVRSTTGRAEDGAFPASAASFVAATTSAVDEAHLAMVEDAVVARRPLRIHYVSANRGGVEWRHASPLRVDPGPPARFVAVCHRADALRWFRVDGIVSGHADGEVPFRARAGAEIDSFLAESIGGFHEVGRIVECVFTIREPEARWVAKNLLDGMAAEPVATGVRVSARTAGVLRVARFVVGLGRAAEAETPELRQLVEELARGALESIACRP